MGQSRRCVAGGRIMDHRESESIFHPPETERPRRRRRRTGGWVLLWINECYMIMFNVNPKIVDDVRWSVLCWSGATWTDNVKGGGVTWLINRHRWPFTWMWLTRQFPSLWLIYSHSPKKEAPPLASQTKQSPAPLLSDPPEMGLKKKMTALGGNQLFKPLPQCR